MTTVDNVTSIKLLLQTFQSLNVECIFGTMNETLLEQPSELHYIQLNTEQAAVHAADGYARATGKPGVVLIHSAAGMANAITGIATAHSDSIPLVVVAGPMIFGTMSRIAFKEVDTAGMTMPITKHTVKVSTSVELTSMLQQLYKISCSGRPGPVLVEILEERLPLKKGPEPPYNQREKEMTRAANEKLIHHAVTAIEQAKRPILFVGGGVISSEAHESLAEIVDDTRIPVVSSLMGIGSMDVKDPLFLGMLGMHGTFAANRAVHQCDLLICVGVRFSDRVTGRVSGFSPNSKKIHVDIDPAEINKIIPVDLPIVADAKMFLESIREQLNVKKIKHHTRNWVEKVSKWKRTVPKFSTSTSILHPQKVIQILSQYAKEDAIVVTDVGQHQMWTAHNYQFTRPRTLITSGGLGTMGFGLPAAIGASMSDLQKQVVCISGDGSFQMNLRELVTVATYQLPLKIAILNNGYLGMVRQWQELFYDRRYSHVKMHSPDFVKLAESYGLRSFRAATEAGANEVIAKAFEHDGPVLLEFDVREEENVYPIVPPNSNNHELIVSPEEQ